MVLGVSYLRVLAQRPTGCCSASYYIWGTTEEKYITLAYVVFLILFLRPLFFNFLVYGFLGGKNGSVGRKKINLFQKALLCQVVEKSYRYMEIVLKSDVLRNY